MYPTLTTRETLMFSARLRLPGSMKLEEKKNRVEHLIEMLGLKECADTYVGDEKVNPILVNRLYSGVGLLLVFYSFSFLKLVLRCICFGR